MYYKGNKLKGRIDRDTDLLGLGPQVRRELAIRLSEDYVRVLDVGTGYGRNAEFLARSLSKGSKIWTLDPSREALVKASEILAARGLGSKVAFVQASANKTDLETGFFDCVVSVMTLHHLDYIRPAVKEMLRVLRTHGKVFLVDFKPEAADKLHFPTRHVKSDFLVPWQVSAVLIAEGATVRARDFGLWYLVEGRKSVAD